MENLQCAYILFSENSKIKFEKRNRGWKISLLFHDSCTSGITFWLFEYEVTIAYKLVLYNLLDVHWFYSWICNNNIYFFSSWPIINSKSKSSKFQINFYKIFVCTSIHIFRMAKKKSHSGWTIKQLKSQFSHECNILLLLLLFICTEFYEFFKSIYVIYFLIIENINYKSRLN